MFYSLKVGDILDHCITYIKQLDGKWIIFAKKKQFEVKINSHEIQTGKIKHNYLMKKIYSVILISILSHKKIIPH